MRLPDDVVRRAARLERLGFTAGQARALAEAGYGVQLLPVDRLLFFDLPGRNFAAVIPAGGAR